MNPHNKKLAAHIIDMVEDAIRQQWPEIDRIAQDHVVDGENVNTLLHGEPYYTLEDKIAEDMATGVDALGDYDDMTDEEYSDIFKTENMRIFIVHGRMHWVTKAELAKEVPAEDLEEIWNSLPTTEEEARKQLEE